tara:strand:- start:826 stop:1251 length:426 start_codon:yes stop_codon:yes gene_type:complete
MANIKLQGVEDVRKILKTASPEMAMSVNQELHKIANEIKSESMGLVPHDEGALRGSATLKIESKSGTLLKTFTVAYGGPAAPYALVQHENLDFFHPSKKRGGTSKGIPGETRAAKYLEIPAKRKQMTLVPRVITAIKRVMK